MTRARTGRSGRSSSRPAIGNGGGVLRRLVAGAVATALTTAALVAGTALPAAAAPVYEITAEWSEGTPTAPAATSRGEVLTMDWRINVNDDQEAAANDPVENVNFTVTLQNGVIGALPDVCLTTDVTPASSISSDGRTLVCNLGTKTEGTAQLVSIATRVTGLTGSEISATGSVGNDPAQTTSVAPIPIQNAFVMDAVFGATGANAGDRWLERYTNRMVDFQWALRLQEGSDPGPGSVSFRLTLTDSNGYPLSIGEALPTSPSAGMVGCSPFDAGTTAVGVPLSGRVNATLQDRVAPTVQSCELIPVAGQPGKFDLRLSGIDYSLITKPAKDSQGNPLPVGWDYVASGSIFINIDDIARSGSVSLTASTPTFTSPSGLTSRDDPGNNATNTVYTLPGGWSAAWQRSFTRSGGSNWDDTYRVAVNTLVQQLVTVNYPLANVPATAPFGECLAFDTRFVTFDKGGAATRSVVGSDRGPVITPNPAGVTIWYYTGNDATLNPSSASYNPDNFNCGIASGWTTTEPANPAAVKAVKATWPHSAYAQNSTEQIQLLANTWIKASTPIGQDVWMFGSGMHNGTWMSDQGSITATPGARYPSTTGNRDILRVVNAVPVLAKKADRAVVVPGTPATYTLTYAANTTAATLTSVDGYTIVDTLPPGMEYVRGSSTPEPVPSVSGGRQVLTWTLDGVTTNAQHALSYQAVLVGAVESGTVLRNSATASYDGTSAAAAAAVTVTTSGYTTLGKTTDQWFIPNPLGTGDGVGTWTVTVSSHDVVAQRFTDTIDVLPYNGDGRGTAFDGDYTVSAVRDLPAGSAVYYSTADPATISDDPTDASNGAPGAPSAAWTRYTGGDWASIDPTAIRVVTGPLAAGAVASFRLEITTDGASVGDVWFNRAQSSAEHTRLVMRTAEPLTMGTYFSSNLKKFVQDADGLWHDANDLADSPQFRNGDTVKYRVVVQNTGAGVLRGIVVGDDLQPEAGGFTIDELQPFSKEQIAAGALETPLTVETISEMEPGLAAPYYVHDYSVTLGDDDPDQLVNTACVNEISPVRPTEPEYNSGNEQDTETVDDAQVQTNCDPAGITLVGAPQHEKSLVSATPTGDGRWTLVYALDVSNATVHPTSYSLDDVLHFTDEASILSASVTASPDGVTLADPAWDGVTNARIASAVPLLGTDDAGYAPHRYEVTVVAEVPLQLDGAGTADDPTVCPPDGSNADTGFNNVSTLTGPDGDTEDDQACAQIPSIDIVKTVASGPLANGDGTWTAIYDLVATNRGAADGVYDMTDMMKADGDLVVQSAEVIAVPAGVTSSASWTGMGATQTSPENLIASGVNLPAGSAHTYQVAVVLSIDDGDGAPAVTDCSADPSGDGGLKNTAGVEHNDLSDEASACITVGYVTIDKSIASGPTPNGDGTWTIGYKLTAENIGAATADYALYDRLRFGEGVEIERTDVTGPDGVSIQGGWTGLGSERETPQNLIAQDVALDPGQSHVYRVDVVVSMDEAKIDPAELSCPAPGSGNGGGLANDALLDHNGIRSVDEVCAGLPLIAVEKAVSAGPTANGDGTWTITYDLVVENTGTAAGDYDLDDELQFGDGVEIEQASLTTVPDDVPANAAWDGVLDTRIAEGVELAAGAVHSYQVRVIVSLDPAVVTPVGLACPPPGSGERGGLANTAELSHNGEERSDDACASLPLIDIVKSLDGAVTPVDGATGEYDVTYRLTVTNRGPAAGVYDLDDRLQPGDGVTIVGIQSVMTDAPDPAGLSPDFDGVSSTRVVTGQAIAAADGAPVVHTYLVTVRYSADLGGIDPATGDACTVDGAPVAGALHNSATVGWNGIVDDDDECIRPGKPTLDKRLVSADPVGGGRWRVVYDLTVGNVGHEATTYELDDEFRFAPAVTVAEVSVSGPDGVGIDPAFDGEANTRIASGITIAGLDDAGYAPHVYSVTVTVEVPLVFPAPEADGTGAPGCTVPAGSNPFRQGLNNAATLTDERGSTQLDTDCAPLPAFTVDKSIVGAPQVKGDRVTTTYELVVSNTGAAAGEYVLRDQLRYGAGLAIEEVTATNVAPGTVPLLAGFTGQGAGFDDAADQLTGPVGLGAGEVHRYRVVVTATITGAATTETLACAGDAAAGGVRNVAAVDHNGLRAGATACAPIEVPGTPGPGLAGTGVELMATLGGSVLLLLTGGLLLVRRRRRIRV